MYLVVISRVTGLIVGKLVEFATSSHRGDYILRDLENWLEGDIWIPQRPPSIKRQPIHVPIEHVFR